VIKNLRAFEPWWPFSKLLKIVSKSAKIRRFLTKTVQKLTKTHQNLKKFNKICNLLARLAEKNAISPYFTFHMTT
jgi:hypothetical protein